MTSYKKVIEQVEKDKKQGLFWASDVSKTKPVISKDMVNHPPHYNQHGIECIDAIQACTSEGFEFYLQGNILKYLWRYKYKNGAEDLQKAHWYLIKLIKVVEDNDKNKS